MFKNPLDQHTSLKDCDAEKVRTFVADVVLTVPDPVLKLRALDAAIVDLLLGKHWIGRGPDRNRQALRGLK